METLTPYLINAWTPAFVILFVIVLVYALRRRHRGMFDEASRMPLRED
jgi:cytochrome c oxidase cbb3-type subunit 4